MRCVFDSQHDRKGPAALQLVKDVLHVVQCISRNDYQHKLIFAMLNNVTVFCYLEGRVRVHETISGMVKQRSTITAQNTKLPV